MKLQSQETTIEIKLDSAANNQNTIVVGTDDQEIQSVILVKRSELFRQSHSDASRRRLTEERDPVVERPGRSHSTRRGRDSTRDEIPYTGSSSRSLQTSSRQRRRNSSRSLNISNHTASSKSNKGRNNAAKGRPSRPTMIRKESNVSMTSQSSTSSLSNRLIATLKGKKKHTNEFQRANSGSSLGRPVAFFEY